MNIYPLSYSIPEEIFTETEKCNETKQFDNSPLIPGKQETYIYGNESSYYKMYRRSKFGLTTKKGGWDCLRHYEMLASKCIPIFPDLDMCPNNTMHNFPKELIKDINSKHNIDTLTDSEYNDLVNNIFTYSKNNLTCEKSAEYFLEKLYVHKKVVNPKILFLSGTIGYRNVNYTRELLAIGLRKTLGDNFVDYPKINILYENCPDSHKYIGKGFTYGKRLKDDIVDRTDIKNKIISKYFDFIVYGKVGKKTDKKTKIPQFDELENLEYWNDVKNVYNKNEIVFVYGGDNARNVNNLCLKIHSENGICFVRELE